MDAGWAWARSELRRRRGAALALVLLIGVSGSVALTAAAGERRTGSAFTRFVESSQAADVQLQYASEADIDDDVLGALRRHPDVEVAAPLYITLAFVEGTDVDLPIYASPEPEAFRDIDRSRILEGRHADPGARDEVVLTPYARESLGVEVGDTIPLGTFDADQLASGEPDGEPTGPRLDMRVVGIGTTPYDLADPEFAGAFSTPAYFEEHWGEVGGFGPMMQVSTRGGRDPSEIVQEAVAAFEFEERLLGTSSDLLARTTDGTRVLALGLAIFAAVAGLAALVACAQALHRRVADSVRDQAALSAIGLTRAQQMQAVALSVAPVVIAGTLLAMVLAVPASALMPIGAARDAEPDPGIDIDVLVLGGGGAVIVVALTIAVAVSAARVSGVRSLSRARRRPGPARFIGGRLSPRAHLGVAMALDPGTGPTSVPVRSALTAAVVGAAGVVAVLTFGASLDALVDEPARSGWNWTLAPDVGDEQVADVLELPGVEDVGRLVLRQVVVDGEPMQGMAVLSDKGSPSLTVLRGRMPAGPREIVVGPKLADRSRLALGDPVEVDDAANGGTREMVVVGEVLFPTFDENAFNDGVAVAPDVIDDLAQSDGFERMIVTFDGGVSPDEAGRRLDEVVPDSVSIYSFPSLPADVANLDGVRFLPRVLGLFLGLLALAAVGHALATSVRRRRRDFGIVRSLGFLVADVRHAISMQSLTLVAVGLGLGVPFGIILGRLAWRVVASGVGVATSPTTPPMAVVALGTGALLLSLLLALLPGRAAGRLHPVDALRVE